MTIPKRVPLQSPIKQLRVEYDHFGSSTPVWRIWLTANGDFSLGTFIELDCFGGITRVTWHADGTESRFKITEDSDEL